MIVFQGTAFYLKKKKITITESFKKKNIDGHLSVQMPIKNDEYAFDIFFCGVEMVDYENLFSGVQKEIGK